jgi:peptidoglycan/xylan/chitin deacetylase (PgdA/CDA1 family)
VKSTKVFQSIPNKRELLARTFGQLGVLTLLEHTAAVHWPSLVVVTYHRIADPADDLFYEPVISATPDSFKTQVDWLADHVRILTLDELVAQFEAGLPWHGPAAFLTFDDGYRDNFDVAAPVLRKRNVPATFFIPTAFLESPRLPWWDYVAYVIKRSKVERFTVEWTPGGPAPVVINLNDATRRATIMMIIRAFLDEIIADEGWFLEQLADRAQVTVDSERLSHGLFMSWEQVRELTDSRRRLTIGSHACTHRKLAELDRDGQQFELAESKHILESHVGREVSALAYPYGWRGTYTNQTKELTALAGYRLAFASQEGLNRPRTFDPFDINRLAVGLGDSALLLRARIALHAAFGRSFL